MDLIYAKKLDVPIPWKERTFSIKWKYYTNLYFGLRLTFSMLSNIVKSISQPTDVFFSNFFRVFLIFEP